MFIETNLLKDLIKLELELENKNIQTELNIVNNPTGPTKTDQFGYLQAGPRIWTRGQRVGGSSKENDFTTLGGCLLLLRPKVVSFLYQRNRRFWKRDRGKENSKHAKLRRQLLRNVFMSRYINTLNKLTCNLCGILFIRLHFGYKIKSCS